MLDTFNGFLSISVRHFKVYMMTSPVENCTVVDPNSVNINREGKEKETRAHCMTASTSVIILEIVLAVFYCIYFRVTIYLENDSVESFVFSLSKLSDPEFWVF